MPETTTPAPRFSPAGPATRGRWWGWGLCLAVFIGLAVFRAIDTRYGIDASDEGSYVSAAMRYHLGDRPFRDEWNHSLAMFDLLLWGFLELYPDAGLYAFRVFGAGVDLAWLAALVVLLSRFAPVWLLALACLPAAFVNNGILAPGYNELGRAGLAFALAGWLGGCYGWPRSRLARLLPFVGGVAFVAGTLAYLPLLVLLVVPAAVLLLARTRRIGWPGVGAATGMFLATVAGGYLAFVLVLAATGLWHDYYRDISWHLSAALGALPKVPDAAPPAGRLQELWDAWWPSVPHLLAVLGLAWLLWASLPRKRSWRGGGLLLAGVVIAGLVYLSLTNAVRLPEPPGHWNIWYGYYALNYWLLISALALHLLAFTLGRDAMPLEQPALPGVREWPLIYGAFLAAALAYMFAQSVLSTNRVLNAMLAVPLLSILAVAAIARTALATAPAQSCPVLPDGAPRMRTGTAVRWRQGALAVLLLWLGIVHLREVFFWTRREWPFKYMQATCTHPALRPIRSEPTRVRGYEALLAYLQPRMHVGDFLHEEDDQPILYFLARARPALPRVWSPLRREFPVEERQRMLDYMLDNHRVPQFFILNVATRPPVPRYPRVVLDEAPHPDPIARYFREHYFWLHSFGLLQLWVRHPDVPSEHGLWRDLSDTLPRWQLADGECERGDKSLVLRAGETPGRLVSEGTPLTLAALGRYTFEVDCELAADAVASFAMTFEQDPGRPLLTECVPLHDGRNAVTVYPGESGCLARPAFEVEQGALRIRSLTIHVPMTAKPSGPGQNR